MLLAVTRTHVSTFSRLSTVASATTKMHILPFSNVPIMPANVRILPANVRIPLAQELVVPLGASPSL
eukprot:818921-Rhodomonas_salina.1